MEDGIWVRFPVYTPFALLAQLEERPNTNREVGGSNPSRCTKDDTKRRMSDVERRVARVHTKDKQ